MRVEINQEDESLLHGGHHISVFITVHVYASTYSLLLLLVVSSISLEPMKI